ncbi:MAG TPA: tetratricopeptide repeat protein [Pirellulaceae bacterium]|nr:tetratricopeptide repeat protein [Pirellulaceae bacterium]
MSHVRLTEAELAARAAARKAMLRIVASLSLVVSVVLVHAGSLDTPFVYDDLVEIIGNPLMHAGTWWQSTFSGNTLPARPLPYLTFRINLEVGGTDVRGFHVANIAIHALNAVLLQALIVAGFRRATAERLGERSRLLIATCVVLVWSVHPLQTQAVTYLYQRIELLMATFLLGTLLAFDRSIDSRRPWVWQAVAIVSCAAGMLTKEVTAVVPILVLLWDRAFVAASWREAMARRWGQHLALFGTLGILVLLLIGQSETYGEFREGGIAHSGLEHLLSQPPVLLHYLRLCVVPIGQNIEYGWPVKRSLDLESALIGSLIVAALIVSIVLLFRAPRHAFLPLAWFLILAPTSSFMPALTIAAEHRMYLPSAIVLLGIGLAIVRLSPRTADRRATVLALGGTVAVAITFGTLTVARNLVYRSRIDLWSDSVAKAPASPFSRAALGLALADAGRDAEAEEHLRVAVDLLGTSRSKTNLAMVLLRNGKRDEARRLLEEALAATPQLPQPLVHLGNLERTERPELAIEYYRRAIELDPNQPQAQNNLGAMLALTDPAEAEQRIRLAIALDPTNAEAFTNLGNLSARQGKLVEAIAWYEQALRLDPGSRVARTNLQAVLAAVAERRAPRRD